MKNTVWAQTIPIVRDAISLIWVPSELCIKKITWRDQLLVDAIYLAVRDQHWNTVPIKLVRCQTISNGDGIQIELIAEAELPETEPVLQWRLMIEINNDAIHLSAQGTVLQDFKRNRVGICVLLPAALAGVDYQVWHSDKKTEQGNLPIMISPHQPVLDIQRIQVNTADVRVAIDFEGDVFEMEDQRNWSDASYKIYSTPLSLPFPVLLKKHDIIEQAVTLKMQDIAQSQITNHMNDETVRLISWDTDETLLPQLGYRLQNDVMPAWGAQLFTHHLQIEVNLDQPNAWQQWMNRIASLHALKTPIELLVRCAQWDESIAAELVKSIQTLKLVRFLMCCAQFDENNLAWLAWFKNALSVRSVDVYATTPRFFAEINRSQNALMGSPVDGVAYTVNPQVHVFGTMELFETLSMQGLAARQAKLIKPKVALSSVSLHPLHFDAEDERLHTHLGAAWFLGSLIQLCRGGISSVTYFSLGSAWGMRENSPLVQLLLKLSPYLRLGYVRLLKSNTNDVLEGLRIGNECWLVNLSPQMIRVVFNDQTHVLAPYQIHAWVEHHEGLSTK